MMIIALLGKLNSEIDGNGLRVVDKFTLWT